MKRNLFGITGVFAALVVFIPAILSVYENRDAVLRTIGKQCVFNQEHRGSPAPCLKVDLKENYVVYKDREGPYHDVIFPALAGADSGKVVTKDPNRSPLLANAWENRNHLSNEAGSAINDGFISLAINPQYSRSDVPSVHIACLRPDIYGELNKKYAAIGSAWETLEIGGKQYLAKKVQDLSDQDPLALLDRHVAKSQDNAGNYGLSVVHVPSGEFLLLANRLNIWRLNFASAVSLQDDDCRIVGRKPADR